MTIPLWIFRCFVLLQTCALVQPADPLQTVLHEMGEAAAKFRTTQADFTWTQYNKVIEDVSDVQKGKIYFRRSEKDVQMAAEITQPDAKVLIFSEGKIHVYQPRIDQVDVYDATAHREEFESFLVLGFGAGGNEMLKSFDIKYVGNEIIDGVETSELDLTPKSEKIRQHFAHILLWIDPHRGLSVQQKLFETSGDYRLAKYTDIQVNQKIPENAFKLKTTNKTKTVNH